MMRALTRPALAGLFSLVIAAGAPAHAGVDEVRAGVSVQSGGPIADNLETGVAVNGEVLFSSPLILKALGSPRPHVGFSIAPDEDSTSYGYAGLTWEVDVLRKFFLNLGGGGVIHDGKVDFDPDVDFPRTNGAFLGCRALFRLHGGVGYRLNPRMNVSFGYEHLSNAGLCDENEGLDNWGPRFGLEF